MADESKTSKESIESKQLLDFITDTQNGKFTANKPDVIQVTYRRLAIQEQDEHRIDEENERMLLFGISC